MILPGTGRGTTGEAGGGRGALTHSKIVVLSLSSLLVVGCDGSGTTTNDEVGTNSSTEEQQIVSQSAGAIVRAYRQDVAEAEAKLAGKTLILDGYVRRIDNASPGITVLIVGPLDGPDVLSVVLTGDDRKVPFLVKGDDISVACHQVDFDGHDVAVLECSGLSISDGTGALPRGRKRP